MAAAPSKRPWYLVLALLGALMLGSIGSCRGWNLVAVYRAPLDVSQAGEGIGDEADRSAMVVRAQAVVQTLDRERARGWPIAVATLVLGTAVFFFAVRAVGRGTGARPLLVQLIVVQALVHALGLYLLRDVLAAEIRLDEAGEAAELRARIPDHERADDTIRWLSRVAHAAPAIELGFFSLASAFVIVGLTRRRSRELLDRGAEAMGEP